MIVYPVAPAITSFPEHSAIIGRLLVGYGEMETLLIMPVAKAIGADVDTAARILYRLRSEAQRLDVADAILRPYYAKLKMSGGYSRWLGAMRWCKSARNQYAHCVWSNKQGDLRFADLDKMAASVEGVATLTFKPVPLWLLEEQEQFFGHTESLLWWLIHEGAHRRDRRRKSRKLPPAQLEPKLYIPRGG